MEWFVRTTVPIVVATLLAWAGRIGLSLDEPSLVVLVTGVVIWTYINAARIIEKLWPPLGRLLMSLGVVKDLPVYLPPGHPLARSSGRERVP